MKRKTKLEIINETVEYYSADPSRRGTNGSTCEYLTLFGQMCAVGRCMINPKGKEGGVTELGTGFQLMLKKEYRGHSIDFWQDLQGFHDSSWYWDEKGLTRRGNAALQSLLKDWGNKN